MKNSILLILIVIATISIHPYIKTADSTIAGEDSVWALITAGTFTFGSEPVIDTIPYDYEMMIFDVTNADYIKFLNEALAAGKIRIDGDKILIKYSGDAIWKADEYLAYALGTKTAGQPNYGHINYVDDKFILTPSEEFNDHPVVFVSWFGAWAYANFYDYRLPTEREWEKAARGNTGCKYPCGNLIDKMTANYLNSDDPFEKGTTPVGYYHAALHGLFLTLSNASPYGVYDMTGNVNQWTETFARGSAFKIIKGGSWERNIQGCASDARYDMNTVTTNPATGFRCVRNK